MGVQSFPIFDLICNGKYTSDFDRNAGIKSTAQKQSNFVKKRHASKERRKKIFKMFSFFLSKEFFFLYFQEVFLCRNEST